MFSKKFFAVILASLFLFAACDNEDSVVAPSPQEAQVRVIHASYDAPAVDVRVNNNVAVSGLAFGASSGYATLPSATPLNIEVTPSGAASPVVIQANLTLDAAKSYTVVAVNSLGSIEAVVAEDNRASNSGKAKVRFIHASPDAPAVDIKVGDGNGPAIFSNASFKDVAQYIEVDAGNYNLVVTPAGGTNVVFTIPNVPLQNGTVYTVIAQGTLNLNDSFPFEAVAYIDNDMGNQSVTLGQLLSSKVRVMHLSYDAPAVDVWLDGNVAISALPFPNSSGYATVTAKTTRVEVTPTGATNPVVIGADLTFDPNKEYTVFAVNNLNNIEPIVSEDMRNSNPNKAKVRFLHASPDAPAVDIKAGDGNGAVLFSNASFKTLTSYIEVDGGVYDLAITPAGANSSVAILGGVQLDNGNVYTVVAKGTFATDDNFDFSVRATIDNGDGVAGLEIPFSTSSVKAIHASPNAPAVDLLVDNTIVGTGLTFPNNTGYLTAASGTRNVKVNVSGTNNSVIDANLDLSPMKNYSVFAVDEVSNISALVLEDDLTMPAPGKAHVRFIHLSPDAPAVDITLTDGTVVFGNRAFKEFTPFTPLDAGTYNLEVRVAGTTTVALPLNGITLEDGKIYTVFAKGFLNGSGDQALGAQIVVNSN